MNERPVIVIGNGGHARVLVDILLLQNRQIIGYTAPTKESNEYGLTYLGDDDAIFEYNPHDIELINAIGSTSDTKLRSKIFVQFKANHFTFSNVIHPKVVIAANVKMGEGVQIMAGVVIQSFAKIADNSIVNTSTSVDHDCQIGKHCHIAPGAKISGMVKIGDYTHIGTGTAIIQNVVIGNHVLIGAGSVVLHDIKSNQKVFGVPAKEV